MRPNRDKKKYHDVYIRNKEFLKTSGVEELNNIY